MLENCKKNRKGFTLLELLVVVLIIGILAAIALPQYKLSVARTKFSELKSRARIIDEAIHLYYLKNDTYPTNYSALGLQFQTSDITADLMSGNARFVVSRYILGVKVSYYVYKDPLKPDLCYVYTTDLSHPTNILCKQETKKAYPNCPNNSGRCYWNY